MADYATKDAGFKGFKVALGKYKQSLRRVSDALVPQENITDFTDQAMELDTGEWTADDFGVRKPGSIAGWEYACSHPIYPVERLKNIDTGELKVRIAFRRGDKNRRSWTTILKDFDTVSNAKNIVSLSCVGVSVTSGKRAQNLVDYLADTMDRNYDIIPETRSVSRVGWNDEGFSPYVKDIVFDGNPGFERIFGAIHPAGDFDTWRAVAYGCRRYSITSRLILASSFASALVGPLGCLPFFVHLWGMDSGTGKTVGQMLAVSVWGNPSVGGPLFPTFKATSVGFEVIAGFLNSIPVVIDELQLAKDARGKINFNVYELASGSGKLRSNKTLGLASTPTWANCFITSGETPIVSENDGAGAVNRVIEIECKASAKVIRDGHETASYLKANYGWAGKAFVGRLMEPGSIDAAKAMYEQYYSDCLKNDTTEKQAMAAAVILTGDRLASEWIWQDENYLTAASIEEFLKSKETVSAANRGYDYMCGWVTQNADRFQSGGGERGYYGGNGVAGETYGRIEDDWAYVIRPVWDKACADAGLSSAALLSHLRSGGLIKTRGRANTVNKRINRIATECVAMKLPDAECFEDLSDQEEIPFK